VTVVLPLLVACGGGRPEVLDGPRLSTPADVPLTRLLTVETDVPTRLSAHLEGPGVDVRVTWPGLATEHAVPVLGAKPDREHTLTLTLSAPGLADAEVEASFRTDPLPEDFPELDVLALDPDRVEPGYVLLPLEAEGIGYWLAAVDAWDGEVAWLYTGPENFGDVRRTPDGTFLGLGQGAIELDALGTLLHRWDDTGDPADPTWIPFPPRGLHHEVGLAGDDALVVLAHRTVSEPAYPVTYVDPSLRRPAQLQDTGVITFGRDGAVRAAWWYADVLDPQRIGFDSLNRFGSMRDWVHGNAVVPAPGGGWLASSRHQDALFSVGYDGALRWILASPAGWRADWRPYLLTVEPPGSWTYHQHGPSFDAEGRLVVFDNHNEGHNPYEPPPEGPVESRVVAFGIDEAAHTATMAWEWRHPEGLFSGALGNATALPGGSVVACYGFLDAEGAGDNVARGLGQKVARIVELRPGEEEPVSDLRFWYPRDRAREGVKSYRAVPTPRLYPDDVRVERQRTDD
jgi:hypothetical protein